MIVNTRPLDLSQKTNSLLARSKQSFVHIQITSIFDTEPSLQAFKYINNPKDYDVFVFTRHSAVTHGAKFVQESLLANKNIPILAIGRATQEILNTFNLS